MSPGLSVAHYRITAKLGEGGMGVVYRATDTKLNRQVAIKILPDTFAADPDRLARFTREAQVLASLNHPNIAAIYGVEDRALVMELVEGPTLAERIAAGAIPVEEALPLVHQLIDAVEYAHERGIIHRDFKPANIKITPEGRVKVLDFGLAKAMSADSAAGDPASSPTLTMRATMAGTIMGTAAYMSPEPARGQNVDKRADIWAFGVVVYELLTGKPLFQGATLSDTVASVLRQDLDTADLPVRSRPLLRACLERDPRLRLRDISDARLLLAESPLPAVSVEPAKPSRLPWTIAATCALAALALGAMLWAPWQSTPEPPTVVRFQIPQPENLTFMPNFAISPDGSKLAYQAAGADGVQREWLRPMDALESHPLPGMEVPLPVPVFWSPDSRFLFSSIGGKLKKLNVAGGPPVSVRDVPATVVGGSINRDGVVVFGLDGGAIQRVASSGGTPSPVTALNAARKDSVHAFPAFLPDGRHFLYLVHAGGPEDTGIYLGSLDSRPEQQPSKRLVATSRAPVLVPSPGGKNGAILFEREGTLLAQPLDFRRLEVTGEAVPVADQLGSYLAFGFFSASDNGTLVYRGNAVGSTRLTWLDRQGKNLGTVGDLHGYRECVAFAGGRARGGGPNGRLGHLADRSFTPYRYPLHFRSGQRAHSRLVSRRQPRRVCIGPRRPVQLIPACRRRRGPGRALLQSDHSKLLNDWSRDGRSLLYGEIDPKTKFDLWVLAMDGASGPRKPVPLLRTAFDERNGKFSPDGRWVAYESNESGRYEIYVLPFPASTAGGGKSMVSRAGGTQPHWRADGREIYYLASDGNGDGRPGIRQRRGFPARRSRDFIQVSSQPGVTRLCAW